MGLNYTAITKVLGILTLIEGYCMLPVLVVSIHFEEWSCASAFLTISLIYLSIGFVILTQLKFNKINLKAREGYFIAFMSWLYCSLLGSLPIYFCGQDFPLISCFFEAVAGFTTTGCTVLDVNLIPKSMLLWRAVCHWLGGMGILVLLVAIFPLWGINNKAISMGETPGGTSSKGIDANTRDTGKFLYTIYVLLSAIEFLLLVLGPMDWYNALISTFSSISTAGLIIKDEFAFMYASGYSRAIVLIFTILSSMNYLFYFHLYKRKWTEAVGNIEIRMYLLVIAVATILVSFSLRISNTYSNLWQAIKDSLCQVVSFISTSGYYVCDYSAWPTFSVTVLLLLMFIGGCSMSTSGSLKIIRVTVLLKLLRRGILKQIHPNMIRAVMLNEDTPVQAKNASAITMHTLLFFVVVGLGTLLLSFNNLDMETTFSTTIGIFSNTGIALGESGTSGYFGMFNGFSQLVMIALMIAGRLEMYAVVILFMKSFWTPNKTSTI